MRDDTLSDHRRRRFLRGSLAAGAVALPLLGQSGGALAADGQGDAPTLPASIRALQPVAQRVVPISVDERVQRLARAQALMDQQRIDAVFIGAGTSLAYFTGMHWWNSERLTGVILPRTGEPVYVTPAFERSRTLEQIKLGSDVRGWQEDEDPYALVAQVLRGFGAASGTVGIEETVPFFRSRGIMNALPHATFVDAWPVTAGCRRIKSAAELALMRLANQTTLAVYEAVWKALAPGMTGDDITALVTLAYARTGLRGSADVNIGPAAASPHGSDAPQRLTEGTPVIFDGGCRADGYTSDITRTVVLGKAGDDVRRVFDVVLKAQTSALRAARPGVAMEALDAAARRRIVDAGYGPDYTYFSHRLGHGIGMDMHEWDYLVRGNTRLLEPGMTFSNEPGIYLPGRFGVRLEDILHITADGAELLTPQSPSIDQPFG
ncbi:Xaa-Pro peptidase family protein [Stenotrophomonas acidaminiphila]|uniref:M24 family metallopeptidase n=1 Tax=Stenotrophomonas acidaminiphila TaxID=128780 RepID=UPI002ABD9C8E|nr:Xaa-Pro peptidase family protein [Stenotrophomonas acidaminiphila]WPU57169.1 Xaa-Pro peptidase family protein [Stenotrophomonas acidaminiphila]